MSRHFSSLVTSRVTGPVLATLALALIGCGEEPTPPRLISFSPAVLSIPGDEALAVSVEYEENDFALQDFQWSVDAGEIEGNGAPSITYHAPADPGDYKIAVTVAYGEDDAKLSLDSVIKVTAPLGITAPVAEASEPETTLPTEPAQSTAPATSETADQAGGAVATGAGDAVEEAAVATGQAPEPTATEEAEETAEGPAETTAAASETEPAAETARDQSAQAVEEVTTAAEVTTEQAPAQAAEGAEQTTKALEQGAQATVAAAREGVEEAERQPATAQPEPKVAALTEEPAATAAGAGGSRLDQILDKHRLTAVVQIAFKPFSFYGDDGRRSGFEVDMVREFARRWLDDPKAVTFLPVPTDARIPTLQKGRADLIAAALTKTPARAEEVDYSLTYFKDGQRLLVPEDSAIADVCDLDGRKVAAIHGSTSLDNVKAAAAACGFELGDNLVTFRRHDDAAEALLAGDVEAFTSDGVALENIAEGRPLKVVGNHFSEEPYGLAVPKGDARLLQLVNHTLEQMEQDGTYAAIYEKWFGDEIRPYPLEESETVAATEVAALATTSAPAIVEPKSAPAAAIDEYVVQPGDTLSRIAGKAYGDVSPGSWQRIYEANRDVIGDNPGRIQVGMTLTIPP